MSTKTYTEREQQVIDRVEAELLSGRTFFLIEQSHKSAPLGCTFTSARGYGDVIAALGRFAAQGDWQAAAAHKAIVKVNAYATPNEVVAQVAGALFDFVREGWHDVRRATGPEPGRPSSHDHAITLRQALLLAILVVEVEEAVGNTGSVPGIGWAKVALMEREGLTVPGHIFPLLVAAKERRAKDAERY